MSTPQPAPGRAPGLELARELEGVAAEQAGDPPRQGGYRAVGGKVDIGDRPPGERIAERAADEPDLALPASARPARRADPCSRGGEPGLDPLGRAHRRCSLGTREEMPQVTS